jgi:hypothetical protein
MQVSWTPSIHLEVAQVPHPKYYVQDDIYVTWMESRVDESCWSSIHVQFVMTTKIIYTTMAVEFPWWAFNAMTSLQRGFLWKGRKDPKGGHCLLAWPKVTHPKKVGGLGIHDVSMLGWALRAH